MKKAKSPSFQFYPADWLTDIKLQTCSLAAQGLLINLMCLMHQSTQYGYLLINGDKPDLKTSKNLLRVHHNTYLRLSKELITKGVLMVDKNGVLFCERMVKDEYIRQVRREAGFKGGNPNLKLGYPNPYYLDKQKDNQKITPSSSSSSSSSKKKIYKRKISDNFNLTKKLKQYAIEKNIPEKDIKEMFDHFKNHHIAKGTVMIDWVRAWYTWVINSKNFNTKFSIVKDNPYEIYKEG